MLLSIEEIKNGLNKEFLSLEPMITGLRFIEKKTKIDEIENIEKRLDVVFPDSFCSLISQYDFGDFSIGPIVFGSSGNYLNDLLNFNSGIWWGEGERPNNKVVIAISDPYTFILDAESESISVITSELNWYEAKIISSNFTLFFCGIGTVYLLRTKETPRIIANQVSKAVGSQDNKFWLELAE